MSKFSLKSSSSLSSSSSSSSSSYDEKTQYTASDALGCKISAISLGYYSDSFLPLLLARSNQINLPRTIPSHHLQKLNRNNSNRQHDNIKPNLRKLPIINRGYYTRVKVIDDVISEFLNNTNNNTNIKEIENKKEIQDNIDVFNVRQIINFGCGFDSLSFRLLSNNKEKDDIHIYELDFDEIIIKKANIILSDPLLRSQLLPNINSNDSNISYSLQSYKTLYGYKIGSLSLISIDMRDSESLLEELINSGINQSKF
jgi:hypothetical protein